MLRNRYAKIAVRTALGVGILFTLVALIFFNELRRAQAETDALLSDVFGVVLHSAPSFEAGRSFHIIVMREAQAPGTRPGERTRARWSLPFDEKLRFPQSSLVTRASFILTNSLPTGIRVKLHLPRGAESVFLGNGELDHMTRSDFIQRFPDDHSWEIFSVSQPGFNFRKTEAILYVDHSCGGLCGGGGYVLMRKVDGVWRIVDEHNTWMS